jgi:hypothetical protein
MSLARNRELEMFEAENLSVIFITLVSSETLASLITFLESA